jgi:uncharacterized beta-barrel protein YwiB (DUF1934 family)
MKDIVLKITGKTVSMLPKPPEGFDDTPVEFITEGKLSTRGSTTIISYDESPLSGMTGCKTSLTITPKKVKMRRTGEDMDGETVMEFEKGKRHESVYETPYGPVSMEVLAHEISALEPVSDRESRMSIEYAVSLRGLMESRKILDIEVVDKN